MNLINKTKQAGFTLVELVVVIVILGILAAFAIPKFADLAATARGAVIDGVSGSLRAAANTVYAANIAKGGSSSSTSVDLSTGNPVALVNGYPAATAAGIGAAVNLDADNVTGAVDGTDYVYTYSGYTDCESKYTAAAANGTPTIAATTTCTATS